MTKSEYEEYKKNVAAFFKNEGIVNLSTSDGECPGCGDDVTSEPFFSHNTCECCGSSLGGNRYHASGYNPEAKEPQCHIVCGDCIYYAEYGMLDDMTMMDMKD